MLENYLFNKKHIHNTYQPVVYTQIDLVPTKPLPDMQQ